MGGLGEHGNVKRQVATQQTNGDGAIKLTQKGALVGQIQNSFQLVLQEGVASKQWDVVGGRKNGGAQQTA